jgi:hypothetical protein
MLAIAINKLSNCMENLLRLVTPVRSVLTTKLNYILLLLVLLAASNCGCGCNKSPHTNEDATPPQAFDEVVVFIGALGTGKSTFCNSIFQKNVFKSGIPDTYAIPYDPRVTKGKQEYIYENKKYIDTPGGLSNELEQALKENSKYKIIFVTTLIARKIPDDQLKLINKVCNAIKVDFEYGIIVNKVSKVLASSIGEPIVGLSLATVGLVKQPAACIIIEQDVGLLDVDDVYFASNTESRKKLVDFIAKLRSTFISSNDVQSIS